MLRFLGFALFAIILAGAASTVRATPLQYIATLDGASEVPPTGSPAAGFADVDFDLALHSLFVHETFSGLSAFASAAHIHSPALPGANAGVAIPFVLFPFATSGTYTHTFDTSDPAIYSAAFLANSGGTAAAAEAALGASLAAGTAYANIHDSVFPGGEIRGQFALSPVPEPSTMLLLGAGLAGFAGYRLRKKAAG